MSVFTMITVIVVSALVAGLAREWIKARKILPIDLSPMENRIGQLESLEERIKVLEAIVTDGGYDLKKEIDSL